MSATWFVLVESNTTGTGRLFCARARDLGLRPVLLTRDPGRYPYVEQDGVDHVVVDTTDPDAVLAACTALDGPVAGVASSSEYYVATAGAAARALGLPHPDPDAVLACRDKHTQRARLRAAGVPGPEFAAATTPGAAVDAAGAMGLPVVVKPSSGSGSIGARLCADPEQVRAAAAYVLDNDPALLALPAQDHVMVEQYLRGDEYSVEVLDTTVVGVTRKHLGPEPYFVETGHDFPAVLDEHTHTALADMALDALRALGLGWGAAHVELRLTQDGPRIVEVNPRLAGGMIPRLVHEALGVDLIEHVVATAAGRPRPVRVTHVRPGAIRFVVAHDSGHLSDIEGVEQARALPGVVEVGITRPAGQDVELTHSFQDRLGYVIAAADAGSVAARTAEQAVLAIKARITPGPLDAEGSST